MLRRPEDFYTLDEATLLRFDGMGVVSARRMLASIEASKRLGLRRCLIGLGIRNAREGTAKRLCHAGYVDLHAVAATTVDELQAVPDIGLVVATSIYETMRREDTAATIGALQAAGVNLAVLDEDRPVAAAGDAPLNGVVAVVTGAITDPATGAKVVRSDFERGVAGLGATIASSVSAKTGLLVCGANVGASKTAGRGAPRRRGRRPGGHLGAAAGAARHPRSRGAGRRRRRRRRPPRPRRAPSLF